MKLTLKNKIILSITASIFVAGSLAVGFVFVSVRDALINREREDVQAYLEQFTKNVEHDFDRISALSARIAQIDSIVDYVIGEPALQDENILEILSHVDTDKNYLAIYIMDVNGMTLASTNKAFVGKNYSYRDYFKNAMKGSNGIDVNYGATTEELGYYFYTPIRHDNSVVGVAVVKTSPYIIDHLLELDIGGAESGINIAEIIDEFGVIIASSDMDRTLTSLYDFTDEMQQALDEKKRYEGIEISSRNNEAFRDYITKPDTVSVFEYYDHKDKVYEIVGIMRLLNAPFLAVVEEDMNYIQDSVVRFAGLLSLFVALAALLAGLFSALLISRFLQPLNTLKSIAKSIGDGNIGERALITSGDELEDLAMSFNKMATSLGRYSEDLEHKVEEQTKTLEEQVKKTEDALKSSNQRKLDLERMNDAMTGREIKMIELKQKIKDLEGEE